MPKLIIDRDKCLGSGQCAYMQPELFQMGDDNQPIVLNEHPEGRLIAMAQDAIHQCPAQAIELIDDAADCSERWT
jgi:ferredoxin